MFKDIGLVQGGYAWAVPPKTIIRQKYIRKKKKKKNYIYRMGWTNEARNKGMDERGKKGRKEGREEGSKEGSKEGRWRNGTREGEKEGREGRRWE